ncbi:MAG: hypothetical protein GXP44_02455 [bacterium]|nr:hypothetical protein [bacterium]
MSEFLNIKKSGHYSRIFIALFSILLLAGGGFLFRAARAQTECGSQVECENELKEIEKQMDELSGVISGYVMKSSSLERDLAILDAKRKKVQLGIRARNLSIQRLSRGIESRSRTIGGLLKKIGREKRSLEELIRKTNELDSTSLVELMLGYENLSDFFVNEDSFESIHLAMQNSFRQIENSREKTEKERDELENQKAEELQLRAIQTLEKRNLEKMAAEKKRILRITKGQEAAYQKLLAKTKKTAAEIRSRIFRLFGGGELSFGEAVKIAQFAGKASGMRAAFILAILAQESAIDGVIGRNQGRCFYNQPRRNRSGTVMSNRQKPSFLAIMRELGRDPNTTPVSCPIVSDGAYGGAMGPAQFMPTTWWDIKTQTGYKKRVAKITGNNPPSPFNNYDAFAGTASYLRDAYGSRACRAYAKKYNYLAPKQLLQERCAAAKYYAGGSWRTFTMSYGEPVVERARKYQRDIDTLNR